jgi:LysR family transcriptional regulator for bpeEF and oprC
MDRLQAMTVFVRVVDCASFTRAAEVLRMPKATVTTLVQQLEAHLGVKLLNRTTRRVSVTDDGAAYYERCVRILAEVDDTETVLRRTHGAVSGRLRIDVPATFGRRVLMPALPEFVARYPGVRLEVGCGDRPVDLLEEGVDCVVRGGDPGDDSLVARRVGQLDFVACATPAYLAQFGEPAHPRDLVRHHCVNYFSSKTGRIFPWDFTRDGERIELTLDGPVAANDGEAYLAAGLAGLGVFLAVLPDVERPLAAGEARRVLDGWRCDPLPIFVMYPRNRHLSAKVRAFVDWVSDLLERRTVMQRAVALSPELG